MKKLIISVTAIALMLTTSFTNVSRAENIKTQSVTVISVYDGDTFTIKTEDNKIINLHLLSAKAPDLNTCFGKKAKKYVEKRILNEEVTISYNTTIDNKGTNDKYTTFLAYSSKKSGKSYFIGEQLIKKGYANAGVVDFLEYEEKAKSQKKGIFGGKCKESTPPKNNPPKSTPRVTTNNNLDITKFWDTVGYINCDNGSGTGFIYKKNKIFIITNKHVTKGAKTCSFRIDNMGLKDDFYANTYSLDLDKPWEFKESNLDADFTMYEIIKNKEYKSEKSIKINKLNVYIGDIDICSKNSSINTDVYVIGYPSYANFKGIFASILSNKILTKGIISGYDTETKITKNQAAQNYYISNRIDSGNSGSPAIAVENGKFCFLGIATWVQKGNFENIGKIQNAYNIWDIKK